VVMSGVPRPLGGSEVISSVRQSQADMCVIIVCIVDCAGVRIYDR
jgi:hypothetical protein